VLATDRIVGAPWNEVLTPIGAMLPTAVMPLQHDLSRHPRRVEIDVREEPVSHADEQRGFGASEIMLVHPGGDHRLMGACPGERFRFHANPGPGLAVPQWCAAFR